MKTSELKKLIMEIIREELGSAQDQGLLGASAIQDQGTIKTRLGNLKYSVLGGLDRGGNRGSYQIDKAKLAALINSIDMGAISKILGKHGIELAARPSEFTLRLDNTGLGFNGLSVITPEIMFPMVLPSDWPERKNRWSVTKEEYEIYSKINAELQKALGGKPYASRFKDEINNRYGGNVDIKNPMIKLIFDRGALA